MLQQTLSQFLMKIKIASTIIYFQKNVCINQLKNDAKNIFGIIIMFRFDLTKLAKEKFYDAKNSIKI